MTIKKMLLASLATLCMLQMPVAEAETTQSADIPFTDISGHWAEEQINQLYQQGVVKGTEQGDFEPDRPVTRAELIVMLLAAKRIEPIANGSAHFKDVPASHWLSPYAETAYRLGFVQGDQERAGLQFNPNEPVKLQELIPILLQAKGKSGEVNQVLWSTTVKTLSQYNVLEQVKEWNQRPMVYAFQKKLITAEQLKNPNRVITRAEAVSFAKNCMEDNSNQTVAVGTNASTPYKTVMEVQTTAYHENVKSYLEMPLRVGIVAVDPNVIPLGTHMYIEGYGYAVAGDIGGAVKGKHVDVFLPSLQAAEAYGRQKDTKVYLLD